MTRTLAFITASLCAASLFAPTAVHAAGQVQVKWVEPEKFADAGRGSLERERTLQTLGAHLQKLAGRLPAGQTLQLEVTDLALAGELQPFSRFHHDVRVLRGGADWPRMSLRYTLSDGTRTLARGDAELSDPHYLFRSLRGRQQGTLAYEKRMLDEWVASLVDTVASR